MIRSIIPNANSCRHRLPGKSPLRAKTCTAWKVSKYGVITGPHFSVFGLNTPYLSVFSPNTEKYGPEITPYLDIFHAMMCSITQSVHALTTMSFAIAHKEQNEKNNMFGVIEKCPCQYFKNVF